MAGAANGAPPTRSRSGDGRLDVDQEAARPFIEAAAPEHPSLIDRSHLVDELFGIVNVPNSVWIDEEGVIVRPVDVSNVQESPVRSGKIDPKSFPPAMRELILGIKRNS